MINGKTNCIEIPSDMPKGFNGTGSHLGDCTVTDNGASHGGGAKWEEVLLITGTEFMAIPTDGSTVPCALGSSGKFSFVLMEDDVLSDNSGLITLQRAGLPHFVAGSSNCILLPGDMPKGIHGTGAIKGTCRVTSDTASHGGGEKWKQVLMISGTRFLSIPTDGSTVPCDLAASGKFSLAVTDDASFDNTGTITMERCE